jgi:mono/diheme cytochrome c family protein
MADVGCLGREIVAGWPERVSGFQVRHRQEDRQTCADELAHGCVRRSTMLAVVTERLSVSGRVHHGACMERVVSLNAIHPRSMGCADRRHHGDCEYGKYGYKAREHASKISTAHDDVHSRERSGSGKQSHQGEAEVAGSGSGTGRLRRSLRNIVAGGLLAGALIAVYAGLLYVPPAFNTTASADVIAQGRQIYSDQCAACHGANLEGQPDWRTPLPSGRLPAPPHDETGHTWHHSDDVLFRIVKEGTAAVVGGGYESDMPGFAGVLSDAEIRAVLDYIKSTWPERERSHQERVSQGNKTIHKES